MVRPRRLSPGRPAPDAGRLTHRSGGGTIPGADLVDAACRSALDNQTGARFDRILDYRLAQVRAELAAHEDGQRLTAEFDALASQPAEALR